LIDKYCRFEEAAMTSDARRGDHTEDQVAGRGAVLGGLIGVVVMAGAVALLGVSTGTGLGGAIGLGIFCAFWGGLGFGSMLGATVSLMRAQERAQTTHVEPELDEPVAAVGSRGYATSPPAVAVSGR
jgi:hypothetical protein